MRCLECDAAVSWVPSFRRIHPHRENLKWCDVTVGYPMWSLCRIERRTYRHDCPGSPGDQWSNSGTSNHPAQATSSSSTVNQYIQGGITDSSLISQLANMQLQPQEQWPQSYDTQMFGQHLQYSTYPETPGAPIHSSTGQAYPRPNIHLGQHALPNVASAAPGVSSVSQDHMQSSSRSAWDATPPTVATSTSSSESIMFASAVSRQHEQIPSDQVQVQAHMWNPNYQAQTGASAGRDSLPPRDRDSSSSTSGVPVFPPGVDSHFDVPSHSTAHAPSSFQGYPRFDGNSGMPVYSTTSTARSARPNKQPSHHLPQNNPTPSMNDSQRQVPVPLADRQGFGQTSTSNIGHVPPLMAYSPYNPQYKGPLSSSGYSAVEGTMPTMPQTGAPTASTSAHMQNRTAASVVAGTGPGVRPSRTSDSTAGPSLSTANPDEFLTISAVPGEPAAKHRVQNYDRLQKGWHTVNKDSGHFSFVKTHLNKD